MYKLIALKLKYSIVIIAWNKGKSQGNIKNSYPLFIDSTNDDETKLDGIIFDDRKDQNWKEIGLFNKSKN